MRASSVPMGHASGPSTAQVMEELVPPVSTVPTPTPPSVDPPVVPTTSHTSADPPLTWEAILGVIDAAVRSRKSPPPPPGVASAITSGESL